MTLSHAQFEALFAGLTGVASALSRRERRRPSSNCGTMTRVANCRGKPRPNLVDPAHAWTPSTCQMTLPP